MRGRIALGLAAGLALSACAGPPSYTPATSNCRGEAVSATVGGEAVMGAGSDGFVSGTDLVFSTRVTPGGGNCTTVGASVG